MAAALQIPKLQPVNLPTVEARTARLSDLPESAQVFRGRELTLKTRRIVSGLDSIDRLIGGGIVRGRVSEILGNTGAGKTSLAMTFAAAVTRTEAAAWIEAHDNLDPASMIAAGIEPARMLWVSCGHPRLPCRGSGAVVLDDNEAADNAAAMKSGERRQLAITSLKTAEWVLAAGGFGLVVIDFGNAIRFIPQSAALRIARAAERSDAAIIVLAQQRMCGTFAVLSLELSRRRAFFTHFNQIARGACATFDGQSIEARVMRNKLGGSGGTALWSTAVDPHGEPNPLSPFPFVASLLEGRPRKEGGTKLYPPTRSTSSGNRSRSGLAKTAAGSAD